MQHHTKQQLSLIFLKLFSISRRKKKKKEPKIKHKDTRKQTRESSRTSDHGTASSQTQTLCLKKTTKDQKQKARKKKKNLIQLAALRPLHCRAKTKS